MHSILDILKLKLLFWTRYSKNARFSMISLRKDEKTQCFGPVLARRARRACPLTNVRVWLERVFFTAGGHGPIDIERGSRGIQQGAAADRAIQDRPDEPDKPNGVPPGDPPTSVT